MLDRDADHVRRAMAGETAAFEALVRRWQGPLLKLAYRYCRDRTLAEDMVQEAFLRIHRKLALYDERSKFSSWMFTVATRVFISEVRRVRPGWLFADEEALPFALPLSLPAHHRACACARWRGPSLKPITLRAKHSVFLSCRAWRQPREPHTADRNRYRGAATQGPAQPFGSVRCGL